MPFSTAFLFVLRAVLKNLFVADWLAEHLLFAIFGAALLLLRKKLKLPQWLLFISPALYLLAEIRMDLGQVGVAFPEWVCGFFSLNPCRWALFFAIGEGIGWLITRIRKKTEA